MYAKSALVKCKVCGLLYVSPRLTRESLVFHFNNHYLQAPEALRWEQSRNKIYQQVLDVIKRFKKKQIFEIGCSYGTFLLMCQKAGLNVGGCEISSEACKSASAHLGVRILNGDVEEVGNLLEPQECVASIDTIYYCSDPQHHLILIHKMLRPGGILVLRVRNALYVELATRLPWRTFPIEHLYFFTPRTLGDLLGKAGFGRWEIIPGVSHGIPRMVDLLVRSVAKLAMAIVGDGYILTRDFCTVAIKE